MKKFFFLAAALMGMLAVSCTKEKEAPVVPATPGKHQISVKATIDPGTRTSYENDKTFSWVAGDVVEFLVLSADESTVHYVEFTAQSSGPETTFVGEVEEGETLYGLAFYTSKGSYMTFGGEGDENLYMNFPSFIRIDGDSEVYYTVDSANPLENLPLTGLELEDGSFLFQTAGGAAKFSFTDVPEGAVYFIIEESTNRLSGQFAMDETGVFTMEGARRGSYEYEDETYYYSSGYVGYVFERQSDGTGTIYVPLPVGEIPAGALIDFYDEGFEHLLYSRPIRSAIPIERNRVTEIASFSATNDWQPMGEGAFYDEFTFYFMDDSDRHFADIDLFKDANTPGVYRMTNPYPVAAADRSYTISDLYELPEYVSFTILKDNYVVYDDIHTGYNDADNIEQGYGDWYLGSPSNWFIGDSDNTFNFVAKYQADGTPEMMVLSPLYLFEAGEYGTQLALADYPSLATGSWKYMPISVYFPGAENQYDLYSSLSLDEIADDTPAHPTAMVTLELGEDFAGADMIIAADRAAARELLAAGKGTHVTESGTFEVSFPEDAPNGLYYAFAQMVPAEGFTENCALLFDSDDPYEYFRSDEDRQLQLEDIIGTYTSVFDYWVNGWIHDATVSMVVDENSDPLSGYPIEFSDFCPEVAKAIAGTSGTVMPQPINATYDTEHGVVTIPADQVAYIIKVPKAASRRLTISGEYVGQDIQLFLRAPGVLELKDWVFLLEGDEPVGALDSEVPITYTRDDVSSAPAAAPRHHSFIPFRTPLENHISVSGIEAKKSRTSLSSEPRVFKKTR